MFTWIYLKNKVNVAHPQSRDNIDWHHLIIYQIQLSTYNLKGSKSLVYYLPSISITYPYLCPIWIYFPDCSFKKGTLLKMHHVLSYWSKQRYHQMKETGSTKHVQKNSVNKIHWEKIKDENTVGNHPKWEYKPKPPSRWVLSHLCLH